MSSRLPLQAVPNQAFSALLDGLSYRITLKQAIGVMIAAISIDDEEVISGSRFFADSPLIPYPHLEKGGGNFVMTTEGDALPAFDQFGVTQFLIYVTADEIVDARA